MTISITKRTTIRLGKIGYLNVLPIYQPLESQRVANDFGIVSGPPARLNDLMAAGELDVSAMSSIEYGRRPDEYLLVPDIAIGSCGPVMSVLLLARKPVQELDGKPILVSAQTHTSATLLKLLAARHWNIEPRYAIGDPEAFASRTASDGPDAPQACLAIGDQALALRDHPSFPYCIDLGEAWREWTGLPFIFGLWGVRREHVEGRYEAIRHAVSLLLRAKEIGLRDPDAVLRLAMDYAAASQARAQGTQQPAITLTEDDMRDYFEDLVFDLGEVQQQGLLRFFAELEAAGQIPKTPELAFFE